MAIAGAVPRLVVARLGNQLLPQPLAAMGGPIPPALFKPGSKLARIDAFLRDNPLHWRLGPKRMAQWLTRRWGVRVFKQEPWLVMKKWRHTRKKISIVPARSRPNERLAHLGALAAIWGNDNMVRQRMLNYNAANRAPFSTQIVFIDEKTFHSGEVKQNLNNMGYAAKGHRVPLRCV